MRARYASLHDPARRVYDFRAQFSPFYGEAGAPWDGRGTLPQDYGMDPITIGAIIAGSAALVSSAIGAGVALSTAEENRKAAQKLQREQVKEAKRQERVAQQAAEAQAKREQEAADALLAQQAALTSSSQTTQTSTGLSTTHLLLLGGLALAALYAWKQR